MPIDKINEFSFQPTWIKIGSAELKSAAGFSLAGISKMVQGRNDVKRFSTRATGFLYAGSAVGSYKQQVGSVRPSGRIIIDSHTVYDPEGCTMQNLRWQAAVLDDPLEGADLIAEPAFDENAIEDGEGALKFIVNYRQEWKHWQHIPLMARYLVMWDFQRKIADILTKAETGSPAA